MSVGEWIAAGFTVATVLTATFRFFYKAGQRMQRLEDSLLQVEKDIAGLVPAASRMEQIMTQLEAISALIAQHAAADGHQYTLVKLEQVSTIVGLLREAISKIEKRQPDGEG